LFSAELARGLIGSFLGAISGGSLYRNASFLQDSIGRRIFRNGLNCMKTHTSRAVCVRPISMPKAWLLPPVLSFLAG
jgi:PmbA protein